MAGGLLNLVANGSDNVLIYGNPTKTFFKKTYKKITNFGMQKIRIDYDGQRTLGLEKESIFEFKIPRYADLLGDTYIVLSLPDIWSSAYLNPTTQKYIPYEFKWISNIGSMMVKNIEIMANGATLANYSGEYLLNSVNRDLNSSKLQLWNKMTGNIPDLIAPQSLGGINSAYPTALYTGNTNMVPSIHGRNIYIPIDAWFCRQTSMAFPLVAMQYTELSIRLTLRPILDLYKIIDVENPDNGYIRPELSNDLHLPYRFLNPPNDAQQQGRDNVKNAWNFDIHLLGNYFFLSEDEQKSFAQSEHKFLIRDIHEKEYHSVAGVNKVNLETIGLISSLMFRFRRNDVFRRNEWDNYTNWRYKNTLTDPL